MKRYQNRSNQNQIGPSKNQLFIKLIEGKSRKFDPILKILLSKMKPTLADLRRYLGDHK